MSVAMTCLRCGTMAYYPAAGANVRCEWCDAVLPYQPERVCSQCNEDLTQKKRIKDEAGRYFCPGCWEKRSVVHVRPPEILDNQAFLRAIGCPTDLLPPESSAPLIPEQAHQETTNLLQETGQEKEESVLDLLLAAGFHDESAAAKPQAKAKESPSRAVDKFMAELEKSPPNPPSRPTPPPFRPRPPVGKVEEPEASPEGSVHMSTRIIRRSAGPWWNARP